MKLVTNFDFDKAVRDINEPISLPREFRHVSSTYYLIIGANCTVMLCSGANIESVVLGAAMGELIGLEIVCLAKRLIKKQNPDYIDNYTYIARERLKRLSTMLKDINVKTNYDMLLKSELYEQKYKIESSDSSIIPVKEEKYIYVPSYGFDGKEKETSILQEHNIGSHTYTLSVGEPEKQYRKVLVNNQA